jgi:hypothetical protein
VASESPDPPPIPEDPSRAARARLFWPAVGLIVVSVLWIIISLGGSAFFLQWIVLPNDDPELRAAGIQNLVFLGVSSGYSLLLIGGALRMSAARGYAVSMAPAIIALVPLVGPCYLLAIPFGIWALVALRRPEVRAGFQPETP